MSIENNKMQVDIENLLKQNVNDLSSIKELYKRIEELGEKIRQIKYIDNTLVKKIKKEYENFKKEYENFIKEYDNFKKIILDENVQAKLINDVKTINSQLATITKEVEKLKNINFDENELAKLTNDIKTINSQLDNKSTLSNKRIYVINETTDNEGVIDLANFCGQGTEHKDIMAKLHNYTDSDLMWLDNVGEGNCVLRLNNSRNPNRRQDKDSNYVGSGDYLILGRHKNDGTIYYQVLKIDKNGNFSFNNNTALTGAIKFDNNKLASDGEPGFIFRTPSAVHNEVLKLKTGGTDRELFSFGGHASGTLALINVGSLMTQGLAIAFPTITQTQHLKYGTANNPYTVPNVIVKSFAPTSVTPHFIGQMFVNTVDKSVYMATEVKVGGWTKLSN